MRQCEGQLCWLYNRYCCPVVQALQAVAQVDRCGRSNVAGDVYEMQLAPNPFNSPKASGSVQSALVVAEMLYALHTNGYPLCATVNLSQTDKV